MAPRLTSLPIVTIFETARYERAPVTHAGFCILETEEYHRYGRWGGHRWEYQADCHRKHVYTRARGLWACAHLLSDCMKSSSVNQSLFESCVREISLQKYKQNQLCNARRLCLAGVCPEAGESSVSAFTSHWAEAQWPPIWPSQELTGSPFLLKRPLISVHDSAIAPSRKDLAQL